ncbi:hypothetical protein CDD82_1131 [Ophiocordyceps australis]|uniref:Uncharacterized protein n=1 Tax=Ophiocordyceps australis TaxID=1399860 RepID=A0A2C5YL97_9HYPO|nr:hypothetical protein CDD82_1131 [Ophiocordyceps australis]
MAALNSDYYHAIEIYEKVADQSINNNLMKYSVKDYLLKAGICHLATRDLIAVEQAIDKYCKLDQAFATQRESMLLRDLLEALTAGSQEQFTDKLLQYDQVSKLDKWKTALLSRVKNEMQADGSDTEFA